jgi:hypothetical protein
MMKITPSDIETERGHWFSSFGNCEREVSARLFVRACKKASSWTVTKQQLDAEDSSGWYLFNGLDNGEWIVRNDDGTFTASHRFICHCYGMFPAAKEDTEARDAFDRAVASGDGIRIAMATQNARIVAARPRKGQPA